MAIKLPVLLDSSLQIGPPLHPVSMTATVQLSPLSSATMIIPIDDEPVSVRQFVRLYGPDGSLGIYRVTSTQTIYGKHEEINLEHGICTLEDSVIAENTEYKGTFRSILTKIINGQDNRLWALGNVDVPNDDDYTLDCSNKTLLQALLDAMDLVYGYALKFDQDSTPWSLDIVQLPTGAECECRMSRNADYVSISRDDADLVTRVFSSKLTDGKLDGSTIGTWGVISRHLDIPDDMTAAQAKRYAQKYLQIHQNPAVSVEIDAENLSKLTKDGFDHFALGSLCRVALPQWSVTAEERIITMHYPDLLAQPDVVMLTLSTLPRTLPKTIATVSHAAGGASSSAVNAKLSGYVKTSTFETEIDKINQKLSGSISVPFAKFDAIQIDNTYINSIVWKTITINGTTYSLLAAG